MYNSHSSNHYTWQLQSCTDHHDMLKCYKLITSRHPHFPLWLWLSAVEASVCSPVPEAQADVKGESEWRKLEDWAYVALTKQLYRQTYACQIHTTAYCMHQFFTSFSLWALNAGLISWRDFFHSSPRCANIASNFTPFWKLQKAPLHA